MAENVLYIVGRAIIPKRVRPDMRLYVMKAGYEDVPYGMFGILFFIITALSYLIYLGFFYRGLQQYGALQFGFLSFITFAVTMFMLIFTVFVAIYFYLNVKIYKRTKEMELLLPDYLTLVSTHLKGGMSFEKALWSAIKPEFGILANEVGLVSKRVMTGNEVSSALVEFSMKYDSPSLRRTIQLMIGEVESGGRVVETIDKIIEDQRKTEQLKKEMAANTVTYMIFIGMLIAVICPVLFALSLQLFTITNTFLGNMAGTMSQAATQSTLSISEPTVLPSDFRTFSIFAIAIISIFSSIIIAIIEKGEVRAGLKYIPMFLVSSLTVYFLASGLFSYLFGGLSLG